MLFRSVINIPSYLINKCSLGDISYSEFPRCYTLQSSKALEQTGVSQIQRNPNLNLLGEGTLIGIIDTGIDYQNKAFRSSDGRTRIAALWDQTISDGTYPPLGFPYGAEFSRDVIDNALQSTNPLDIVPSTDTDGHGTYIAGIAAGTPDLANDFSGVVPKSNLVVVKLKKAKNITKDIFSIPEEIECYQETDIMFGIKYVISVAIQLKRPISICIALGTSQGSHSGQEPLSVYLSYLTPLIGIGISIASGNEGNTRRHYLGNFKPNETIKELDLNVANVDKMFAKIGRAHV